MEVARFWFKNALEKCALYGAVFPRVFVGDPQN
jgi:hypothetical protein